MSSTEGRTSRMPEIENIALREVLKDFGLELVTPGDDIVLHVGRGSQGLFVSRADKASSARSGGKLFEEIDALCAEIDRASESGGGLAPELRELLSDDALELLCRNEPEKAFEFGVDILMQINDTLSKLVENSAIRLAEMEAFGERLDRSNEENKQLLAELVRG